MAPNAGLNAQAELTPPLTTGELSPAATGELPPPPSKKPRPKVATFLVILLLAGAIVAVFANHQIISDTIVGLAYQPSAAISAAADKIALTEKGERIFKASRAELQDADSFNQNCPSVNTKSSVLGCYNNWQIYIYDVQNAELDGIKEAVLAHELLHAVWQRESEWTKNELEPLLRAAYEENRTELEDHMKEYDEESFIDELHSVVGTQVDPSSLSPRLRDHYAGIFKDHKRVVDYYNRYNDKFVAINDELKTLGAKINQMKEDIEQKSAKYRDESKVLADDIANFNRHAEGGYYSGNLSGFESDRAALVERQNKLNDDYDSLNRLVDETNALVDQYNKNVIRSGELYDSINSNVKKVDGVAE